MVKIIKIMLCILFVISLAGCNNGSIANVEVNYGFSSVYTKKDMDEAIEVIKNQFKSFDGCELHSISYSSDEESNNIDNISWMNELSDNTEEFTQCIMFNSSFHSPRNGGGAWEADEEYTWTWWLARSENTDWKLMTYGY